MEASQNIATACGILVGIGKRVLCYAAILRCCREYQELLENDPNMDAVRPKLAAALRVIGPYAESAQVYAEPLSRR